MDAQRYQLTRQLFVIATELVEDAHEAAIAGQSQSRIRKHLIRVDFAALLNNRRDGLGQCHQLMGGCAKSVS